MPLAVGKGHFTYYKCNKGAHENDRRSSVEGRETAFATKQVQNGRCAGKIMKSQWDAGNLRVQTLFTKNKLKGDKTIAN